MAACFIAGDGAIQPKDLFEVEVFLEDEFDFGLAEIRVAIGLSRQSRVVSSVPWPSTWMAPPSSVMGAL